MWNGHYFYMNKFIHLDNIFNLFFTHKDYSEFFVISLRVFTYVLVMAYENDITLKLQLVLAAVIVAFH